MSNSKVFRVICFALLLTFTVSCSEPVAKKEALLLEDGVTGKATTTYQTATAEYGSLARKASGEGSARYPVSKTITCGLDNAVLKSVNVSKGAAVKKGDVIAEFEIAYSKSELQALYSNLEIAKKQYSLQNSSYTAQVDAASSQLSDTRARFERGEATENAVKKAELLLEKAQLSRSYFVYTQNRDLSAQQKAIDAFESRVTNNKVLSPIDGIVQSVNYLTAGTTISKTAEICVVYSPDEVLLAATVDSVNGMRYNQDVTITVTNHQKQYTGRIISAPNVRGESTGTVLIRPNETLEFDPADRMRRISIVAERFTLDNVLILPTSAVNNEDGRRFVYLYEDGIVKKRYVICGLSDITSVQIIDGLEAGQTVVIY